VWERCDEPWPQLFDRAVKLIADAVIKATTMACLESGVDAGTEVFALMLAYRGDTDLDCGIYLGLDADRRAWLASGMSGDDLSDNLWHLDRLPSAAPREPDGTHRPPRPGPPIAPGGRSQPTRRPPRGRP
jgi:hypothetical protein